jgi:thiol:disulfide interchange protein DsbD
MSLSGNPIDLLWAFFGGVLVSFTPCIYPLLPITVAYIGASSTESRLKGFSLSMIYVTGVSITYATLGLVAVLTGSIFGRFSSQFPVRIISGLVIIFFGIFLLTGRDLRLPGLKLPIAKKTATYLSCFILGLTSGLVISPCTAPILGSILVFVAAQRNFIYGAALLFSFAFGMGLLLILAGTFSSILVRLPKSGKWMVVIKKSCAIILISIGAFFAISGMVNLVYAQESKAVDTCFDFELRDLDGNTVTFSEFRDKNSVILFFWTTWCPYCRTELKNLNEIHSRLMTEGIEVLAINIQESELKVKRFLENNPVVFKVLLDLNGEVASSYEIIGVPTFVLINKQCQIAFKDHYLPLGISQGR